MGALDAINSIGLHIPSPDDCATDGNGDIFADTKGYPEVDPATRPEITETDSSAQYAANNPNWGVTNSYNNNEYAYEVARNLMQKGTAGTNPFSNDDFNRMLYQEKGSALNFYSLA